MGKIVFIDVDGTLVNYEGKLPHSAITAIRAARKSGHRIYIATGRSRAEVYKELWDIGLDGMIGGNGSYVEDHEQVIMHRLITMEQARRIVDWLHERGLEFYLESNNGLFASEHFEQAGQTAIQKYAHRKGRPGSDAMTVRDAFPDMVFGLQGSELYREDLNKVSYLLNSYQDFLDTKARFPDLENNTWGGAGETALFGDIGVRDITKSSAVNVLLRHLGADLSDTVAIGDAKIDIPMFEACAYSVCMGNGGPDAKAAADYVTDDVDNDGLYKAFEHLKLL